MSSTKVTLVGSTGLTGSATLKTLLQSPHPFNITTLTRSAQTIPIPTATQSSSFANKVYPDLQDAPKSTVASPGGVFVSCLGTTRALAGGLENQEKIDVYLNIELAQKARKDGAEHAVFVSTKGADAVSRFPYTRMKGTVEENLKRMGFKTVLILRPGFLLGDRTFGNQKPLRSSLEYYGMQTVIGLRKIGFPMASQAGVDADDVGAAIAFYAESPPTEAVTILDNNQIADTAKEWRAKHGKA